MVDKQEPVAWITDGGKGDLGWRKTTEKDIPLYTAPPKRQWVGLTVNEARMFYEKYTYRGELIYAIDKFLEEKNGG